MKKERFSETQIVAILQQQASGQNVAQIVREHGLSEATFYKWKSKYAGASVAELTRLKQLEEENRKLRQMFADLSLENQAIEEILRKM
ncbi:IS66 family insertion sequence element accessory protein TnpA [Hymenobacter canadensis]|uniref:Transposase n=1 Tax=Hymenobacter canadensis TaxID=2999067 RepID=A0ABY7LUE0_9BACT|nr:transposase [Hymenobacter canadensis]WBA44016.1 transposase [Hymenobacter canadensis]